ncbi:hypothetical protein ABZX95_10120 [Streptomyces sp. NPDC004232]|jgi:hypothetical protein|uniref:hypothetical protein n=1 Tax=unclassified Streptomyces TaxID=2593676 RepID=UPI0033A55B5D
MDRLDGSGRVNPAYRSNPAYRLDRMDRLEQLRRADRSEQPDRAREPIYARLVAEWRAHGRAVPAEPDVLFAVVRGFAPRARPVAERT